MKGKLEKHQAYISRKLDENAENYSVHRHNRLLKLRAMIFELAEQAISELWDVVEEANRQFEAHQGVAVNGLEISRRHKSIQEGQQRIDVSKLLLQEENGRFRQALEFYADEKVYEHTPEKGNGNYYSNAQWDSGKYAREALQERMPEEINMDLYCMAQHLYSFVEDAKYNQVANFAKPCTTCKYSNRCNLDFWRKSRTLAALTGIRFSALVKRNREN